MNRAVIGALCVSLSGAAAQAAEPCTAVVAGLSRLDLDKGAELIATRSGAKTFKALYDVCDATDRFAEKPLPTFKGRQLRCSTDRNHVAFLRKFPDGTIVFKAKMSVDADGSPASMGPHHSPTDQPETWLTFDAGSDRRFVNAEDVSFIVVPLRDPKTGISVMKDTGIAKGDLALVVRGDRCSFGVVGDAGPYFRLGEASIRAHADLGNPQCATAGEHPCQKLKAGGSGSGIASGVTYVVFPGTRPRPLLSQTVTEVANGKAAAAALEFFKTFAKAAE